MGGTAAGGSGGGYETAAKAGSEIASALIGGIFDYYQGKANREQQERFHAEEMGMANKQFDWGQKLDRFNMKMTVQEAAAKMNETQRGVLMDALKTNLAVKDRAGNLFSGGGG
jgi:hypothetical protein